jgi:hypothetical protein
MLDGQMHFATTVLTNIGLGIYSNNAGQLPSKAVRQVCRAIEETVQRRLPGGKCPVDCIISICLHSLR